jgi:hypothetical protein
MKRLDQGHLHPKLEIPGLICSGREENLDLRRWEASTLEQLVKSYSEHLHMGVQPVANARDRSFVYA